MQLLPMFRRLGFILSGVLLTTGLGCNKSSSSSAATPAPTVVIKGKVTYDRIPLVRDVNGVPTGLETDASKYEKDLPARYLRVNLYQKTSIPDPAFPNDASKNKVFFGLFGTTSTGVDGAYRIVAPADNEWMVEIQGAATRMPIAPSDVNVLADPDGMNSTVPQQSRLRYCIRKAPDGSLPPTASGVNHVATSALAAGSGETTVDFHVGVGDPWFLANTNYDRTEGRIVTRLVPGFSPGMVEGSNPNGYDQAGQLEATPTGSRILSILDAFVDLAIYSGATGTNSGTDSTLDLHYAAGQADPRGTFIQWDRSQNPGGVIIDPSTMLPTPTGLSSSLDIQTGEFHYFGSVKGTAADDDAWDRGLMLVLAARAQLFFQFRNSAFTAQSAQLGPFSPLPQSIRLDHLDAQMAALEGIPHGLAAVIQLNPYIADTTSTGLTYVDVRDLSTVPASDRDPHCAQVFSALAWELALKAKALPSPGAPADWATILPKNIGLFATLTDASNFEEPFNLYTQLKAMQSPLPGGTGEASPITDAVLQSMLANMGIPAGNIPWPRPITGAFASFATPWGLNPTSSTLSPILLSMSQATAVGGTYGNISKGEIAHARFLISASKAYAFDVEFPGGPMASGKIEVSFIGLGTPDGRVVHSYTFTDSTTASIPLQFQTRDGGSSTWLVRVRMHSPTALQPDTTVKIKLVPAA